MARFICKIPHAGQDYYLLYSSVSDSFSTYGVCLETFNDWMAQEEGDRYMRSDHARRMVRVEKFGTSSMNNESVEELISCNRCGPDEEEFTMEEVINKFIAGRAHL